MYPPWPAASDTATTSILPGDRHNLPQRYDHQVELRYFVADAAELSFGPGVRLLCRQHVGRSSLRKCTGEPGWAMPQFVDCTKLLVRRSEAKAKGTIQRVLGVTTVLTRVWRRQGIRTSFPRTWPPSLMR